MKCLTALATRIPTRGIGLIGLCCCLALGTAGAKEASWPGSRDVVVVHQPERPRSEKQAILIIPGLDEPRQGRRAMSEHFSDQGYDLFIPDYVDADSFEGSVTNFKEFYRNQHLGEYEGVHVLSYILGSWVLNRFIDEVGPGNIRTIVYDRSPLQERAALVATENIPFLTRLARGRVVEQFSKLPYAPIAKGTMRIGILVEGKATRLVRHFKSEVMAKGVIEWTALDFRQDHDDLMFVPFDHVEMYSQFDLLGPEILHFIRNGRFTGDARRTWYGWDPFKKRKRD